MLPFHHEIQVELSVLVPEVGSLSRDKAAWWTPDMDAGQVLARSCQTAAIPSGYRT